MTLSLIRHVQENGQNVFRQKTTISANRRWCWNGLLNEPSPWPYLVCPVIARRLERCDSHLHRLASHHFAYRSESVWFVPGTSGARHLRGNLRSEVQPL